MDLNTYLSTVETAKSFSEKTGIIEVLISQWRNGVRSVPVSRCIAIENATDKRVTRRDLRPNDWHLIWPELIGLDTFSPDSASKKTENSTEVST